MADISGPVRLCLVLPTLLSSLAPSKGLTCGPLTRPFLH